MLYLDSVDGVVGGIIIVVIYLDVFDAIDICHHYLDAVDEELFRLTIAEKDGNGIVTLYGISCKVIDTPNLKI